MIFDLPLLQTLLSFGGSHSFFKSAAGEQAANELYDAALARWPVPYEALTVKTRYGETYVIDSGDRSAPPLILLHGSSGNSSMWEQDIAIFSRQYRVYSVDIPGEPGRSVANRLSWRGLAYADWLGDVLDGLQVEQATVLGISLGGWLALRFATVAPERVCRLLLLCPGGITNVRPSLLLRVLPLLMLGRWGVKPFKHLLFGRHQRVPVLMDECFSLIMSQYKVRVGILPVISDIDLRRLTMPTLLLVGADDPLFVAGKVVARMQRYLPNLTSEIIPATGHMLLNQTARVLQFLS